MGFQKLKGLDIRIARDKLGKEWALDRQTLSCGNGIYEFHKTGSGLVVLYTLDNKVIDVQNLSEDEYIELNTKYQKKR